MMGLLDMYPAREESLARPTFWTAVALSVLLHVLMLGKWLPQVRPPSLDQLPTPGEKRCSLVLQRAPPASPPPPPPSSLALKAAPHLAPAPHSPPAAPAPRPRAAPPPPPPPVMALNQSAPA